jgi:hypothetical protein
MPRRLMQGVVSMFGTPRRAGMFGNQGPQMRPLAQPDPMGLPEPDLMGGNGGVQPQPMPQQPQMRDPYAPATGSRRVVGILGDFISGMAGGPANFANSQNQLGQERRQFQQRQQLAELEANQPMVRTVGNQVVRIDPRTGQSTVLHEGQGGGRAFEDNAGNQWETGPDGTPRLVFRDPTPRYTFVEAMNEDGDIVRRQVAVPNNVPMPGAAPQGGQPAPMMDLPPGFQIDPVGGQGGPAAQPAQSAAGGRMTASQAATVLRGMGGNQQQFNDWVRRHNIQIVN